MSDCRVNKKASASLSLRLPRGRPPAVGVDSSFFNLTPPSAEALTPTNEDKPKVITETVEQSVKVEAKEPANGTVATDRTAGEITQNSDRLTETPTSVVSQLPATQRILPDQTPIITDKEPIEVPTEAQDNARVADTPVTDERVADTPMTGERVIPVDLQDSGTKTVELTNGDASDKFILAERPDFNPNPHSTPAAPEPEQRLDPSS